MKPRPLFRADEYLSFWGKRRHARDKETDWDGNGAGTGRVPMQGRTWTSGEPIFYVNSNNDLYAHMLSGGNANPSDRWRTEQRHRQAA